MLAAFGILTVLWDVGARRTAGAPRALRWRCCGATRCPASLSLVPVALVTYLASWTGWFATSGRLLPRLGGARTAPAGPVGLAAGPLRSLWHYEAEVYDFHVGLTSQHTYESNPWSWLVVGRPSRTSTSPRRPARTAARPGRAAAPAKCWRWARRCCGGRPASRCCTCSTAGCSAATGGRARSCAGSRPGYLPWFLYQERTIFYFYAVVFVPFLCLAVTMMIGALAGTAGVEERRRTDRDRRLGRRSSCSSSGTSSTSGRFTRARRSRWTPGATGCGSTPGSESGRRRVNGECRPPAARSTCPLIR